MKYIFDDYTVHNHIKFTHVMGDKMNGKYHTRDPN